MDRPDDDEIRADVERALHDAVGLLLTVPQALGRRLQQCVAASVDRATAPVQIVKSFADVTLGRVVSPAEDRIESPRPDAPPAPARSRRSPTAVSASTGRTERPKPGAVRDESAVAEPVAAEVAAALDEGVTADPAALPIDQYESLAASHVVARLESLTPDELRTVRSFETSHRGRRTVLGKIDQLLAAGA